jgi:hypothetical protein
MRMLIGIMVACFHLRRYLNKRLDGGSDEVYVRDPEA